MPAPLHALRLLVLFCCSAPMFAQEFADELAEAKRLIGEKQWANALARLEALAEKSATDAEREQVTAACLEAGDGAKDEGNLEIALKANERALALRQAVHGKADHRDVALGLNNVAYCMENLG